MPASYGGALFRTTGVHHTYRHTAVQSQPVEGVMDEPMMTVILYLVVELQRELPWCFWLDCELVVGGKFRK
jgi:hypothetical protein